MQEIINLVASGEGDGGSRASKSYFSFHVCSFNKHF